jgi:large subunit ribosomal protein L25
MIFTLTATPRTTVRKSDLTTLRASGLMPAVIYGPGGENLSVALKANEFFQYHKKSFSEVCFWEIEVDGKKFHTILKDKQVHPVTRNFLHADFMIVSAEATLELEIPIHFTGEAVGTKEGGMLEILQRHVKVLCKSTEIPEEIVLDISNLKVGESLHVGNLPKGTWQFKDHAEVALVAVHPKKKESQPEAEKPAPQPEA